MARSAEGRAMVFGRDQDPRQASQDTAARPVRVRRAKKRKARRDGENANARATRARAEYVEQCIRDQWWLDGDTRKLRKLLQEKYPCSDRVANRAIALCYEWMDAIRAENLPRTVSYLDRVHRKTIEMGQRTGDLRAITPAAEALRKLHGIGEADRVQVSGSVQAGLTPDAAALIGALKLTNAQRLAEIDKLERELGEDPVAEDQPSVVTTADTDNYDTGDTDDGQEPSSTEDDSDDDE